MKKFIVAAAAIVAALAATVAPAQASSGSDELWDYRPASISGTYTRVVGNFAGDPSDDILWYAPGTGVDTLWTGAEASRGTDAFGKVPLRINGTYTPIVGDFAGDGYDDILWYAPGPAPDYLWVSVAGGATPFESRSMSVSGTYRPVKLADRRYVARDGVDGKDDIFWYAPGSAPDSVWHFSDTGDGTRTSVNAKLTATVTPVVGDWNGDQLEDLVLYGPGGTSDAKWLANPDGTFQRSPLSINGTYQPATVLGDPTAPDATRYDAILWYGGAAGAENYWRSTGTSFTSVYVEQSPVDAAPFTFLPGTALLYTANPDPEGVFLDGPDGAFFANASDTHAVDSGFRPLIGDFDWDGFPDVFWYGPGSRVDQLWYFSSSAPSPGATGWRSALRPTPREVASR